MTRGLVTVSNSAGLHARAAVKFVQLASSFQSKVSLRRNSLEVNGKSILGILQLGATLGTQLQLVVEGSDETEGFAHLKALVEGGFGERK